MKYRMYMVTDAAQKSLNQEFEADSDDDAIEEVKEFRKDTGIPVKAIARVDSNNIETVIREFD